MKISLLAGSTVADTTSANESTSNLWSRLVRERSSFTLLVFMTLLIVITSVFYAVNFIRWTKEPDLGWSIIYQTDMFAMRDVRGKALDAGLQSGDRVISINGQHIVLLRQLREVLNREIGQENLYEVERDGLLFWYHVPNAPRGLVKALLKYGTFWITGIVFFIMGVLVLLMKPGEMSSRTFLSFCFFASLFITLNFTGRLIPDYLNNVLLFIRASAPAAIIQLAMVFPEVRIRNRGARYYFWSPMVISGLLFILMRTNSPNYGDLPSWIKNLEIFYLATSVLSLLFCIGYSRFKASSSLTRKRSQVVLMGSLLAFGFPIAHLIVGLIAGKPLLPNTVVVNLAFYIFFPLSIGYAIAKHNLFDVDVFIKRTVGYGLITVFVGLLYVGFAALAKPAVSVFPSLERFSAIYPVLFALLVVVFFRPTHSYMQAGVDRLFYRGKYDYRDAVISLGDTLTTVLNLNEVIIRIIHAPRDIMSIDTAGVILIQPQQKECPALFVHDAPGNRGNETIEEECLDLADPIVSLVLKERRLITKYDIAEDLRYAAVRDECSGQFESLRATMALPLIFDDRITGILLLGRKKSGRFYTRDDIDLLSTLVSQGAIAIENAKRAEKMKEEEVVRAHLARYLPREVIDQIAYMDVEGERINLAVLISDIRGFTDITRTQPPERLVAVLNEYRTEMVQIIFEHDGSLDKYVGDAIVAVFGGLIPLENPTSNAVKTAIDMVNRMSQLNEKWEAQYEGFHMDIGFGIDTGEVFMGNVGHPDRMEFTVIGVAVNTADNLSNLAKPNQILLSEAANTALGGNVDVRKLEQESLKSKVGILEVVR